MGLKLKKMKKIAKHLTLFSVGGSLYFFIELLYRRYSHWTMFILGGLCFLILGGLNEILTWETPLWKQIGVGVIIVTILEFITGYIVNILLKWNVWDYSSLPFNLLGQISLLFCMLWIPLVLVGILLDDYLRYCWFSEERPKYKIY